MLSKLRLPKLHHKLIHRQVSEFRRSFSTFGSLATKVDYSRKLTYQLYTKSHIPRLLQQRAPLLNASAYRAAAEVFPMRVNDYVVDNLIDW